MRRILAIGVLAFLSLGAAGDDKRAVEDERTQQALQPGNNAPIWREVRSSATQSTKAHGIEAGVLMQSRGETWRELRPPISLAGALMIAGSLCALALFYRWRGTIRVSAEPTGRLIERFSFADRVAHWSMGISFVALAVTGLTLNLGKYLILPVVGYTLFSWFAIACKSVHNFVGPVFMASAAYFIVLFVRDNLPRRCDIDWLLKGGGMFTGAHVPSGRFNAGEKTLFWGLVCAFSAVLCVSGLVLDFPNAGQGRSLMQDANIVHMSVAFMAIAAALFHIYLGTLGVAGAYAAMRDGAVDESWAREHHEIWYDEVRAGKAKQHFRREGGRDGELARMVSQRSLDS